ncbi:MAG: SMP-30/gluconolactonase/LRE family protein [Actinomycetota bacterium]|jgi:sugar lactone lactonase YvrE|nr:SMP-30/gluconolactonase/LRE family protein [Actinomycetota bacterium]
MAIDERHAEVALEVQAMLGEGPVWDERRGALFFVDIVAGRVHRFTPASGEHGSFLVGPTVGAVALREDGGLVLAAHDGFFYVEADGSGLAPAGSFRSDAELVRFNDGKADPYGRFVAGTMDWNEERPFGSLYLLEPGGAVSVLLEDVTISNGLAWTERGDVVYYIDTPRRCVDSFDFDAHTGTLANRRIVASFEGPGAPDGMTIDDEGCLWVALWGGSRVERIDPRSGERLTVVHVPASQVTSAAFGGARRDVLYITTARRGLDDASLARQPHAGDLFAVEAGVSGPAAHRFVAS